MREGEILYYWNCSVQIHTEMFPHQNVFQVKCGIYCWKRSIYRGENRTRKKQCQSCQREENFDNCIGIIKDTLEQSVVWGEWTDKKKDIDYKKICIFVSRGFHKTSFNS